MIGLGVQKGVVFNLANTSEHVGMVGEEPIDGLSWLPPLGSLPALLTMQPHRVWHQTERDAEVADLVRVFSPRELWIGGGLAMNKSLVERRNAIFKAGSEVSALGIAKLAQRTPHGDLRWRKVGRGFLAQLLSDRGGHSL